METAALLAPSPELQARLAEARAAWPGVELGDGEFLAHLAGKLGEDGSPDALARIRLPELFLACACLRRDPKAIAHLEQRYFGEVDAAFRRFDSLPVTLEDVRQRMREKLFLHTPPALAGYAGHGDLRGWLRAAALHLLLNISTRESRERPTEDGFFDAVVDAGGSSEAEYLKMSYRAEFEQAFAAAVERLSNRDKSLLRYAFADGLNVDEIGAIFRVHRATAARWIAKARTRLVRETRAELMARLEIGEGDAASIVRGALSRVGSTLVRNFAGGRTG